MIKALVGLLVVLASFGAGMFVSQMFPTHTTQLPEEFDVIGETWHLLSEDYVNKSALDPDILSRGAVEGMLEALGDPYTSYIDSIELELSDLEGSFEGIGALVSIEEGELTVVSPIEGGPAERQGVRAEDKILEINGEATSEMSLTQAILKIRGPEGTTVVLLILHDGETTPVEIEIVREVITLDSVYLDVLTGDIAVIRITHFTGDTSSEFKSVLEEALADDAQGIILDLRGNPGGYLHVVVEIADEFLDGGIVLYEADDDGVIFKDYEARPGGLAVDVSLTVLVDGGSASGSEVLAGAFQDRGRAPLIGTKTYGKGSVNVILALKDGSALYVTTARWLTPDQHMIEGVGLYPDIEVELTEDDIASGRDPQLDAAVEYLQNH
jgi:carboxyl-terminal processing protease